MPPTKAKYIECDGLDPEAPYSLGNKRYYYERQCNSGHKNLSDNEIGFTGGYYDGYNWTVPVCLRCVKDGRVGLHSHNTPVHLVEIDIDAMVSAHVQELESAMSSFIKNPSTIEELKQNVEFQMENVKGWLSVNDYQSALLKAKCLVDALQEIVTAEESEQIALQSHSA